MVLWSKRLCIVWFVWALLPVQSFGLTPQEKQDLILFLDSYKQIEMNLTERLAVSDNQLLISENQVKNLKLVQENLNQTILAQEQTLARSEKTLKDYGTLITNLKTGLRQIQNELTLWKIGAIVAAVGGFVLGAVLF